MPIPAALAEFWAFLARMGGWRWAVLAMVVVIMAGGGNDGLGKDDGGGADNSSAVVHPALAVAMALRWPMPGPTPDRGAIARDGQATVLVRQRTALTVQGAQWRSLVCAPPFTWRCDWALAVIMCESGGNPSAYNPVGPYYGLFQVLHGPYDPYLNAVEAHIQYAQYVAGLRPNPWPNCP